MPATHTLLAFGLVAAAFVAIPGPSNLFVVACGLQSGSRAAVAGAAGCATGALTYVAGTAAGLSAVLASSDAVLAVVHYAGAAYLCWLGVAALRPGRDRGPVAEPPRSPLSSYRRGLLVELGNPKVALFFLALFPQFVHPAAGAAATQVLLLGGLFVAIGLASDCLYAVASGRLRRWRDQRRAVELVYLGLGGWAALSGSR
jgi:threonine/homoserine/homoserine lactone efflux protein